MQAKSPSVIGCAFFNIAIGAAGAVGGYMLTGLAVLDPKSVPIPLCFLAAGILFAVSGFLLLDDRISRIWALVIQAMGILFGIAYIVPMFQINAEGVDPTNLWDYLLIVMPAMVLSFAVLELVYLAWSTNRPASSTMLLFGVLAGLLAAGGGALLLLAPGSAFAGYPVPSHPVPYILLNLGLVGLGLCMAGFCLWRLMNEWQPRLPTPLGR